MKSQAYDKPQIMSKLLQNTSPLHRAAMRKTTDDDHRVHTSAAPRFRHSFSRIAAEPGAPINSSPSSVTFCPLFPQRCPFGGACHKCPPRVQAKGKIGRSGDEYEREADDIARKVESSPPPPPEGSFNKKRSVHQIPNYSCRKTGFDQDTAAHRSAGRPLTSTTRNFMESRFGADFRHVRLHTDEYANHAALRLKSRAFTQGNHIWLGKGESEQNKKLMAHELTHVVQQGRNQFLSNSLSVHQFTSGPIIQRTTVTVRENCRGTQEEIEAAVADARIGIGRIADPEARECLLDELNDANVVCDRDDICGEASYAGSTIYVYNWGGGCPSLPALLVHETSHKCKFWWTEEFAEACENEAYGGRGATPPGPGEEGGICEL